VVSYASDVKRSLLDVPPGPVVSADAVRAMAAGVRSLLGADVGLAVTGVAGPDPQDGEAPGTVFLGVAGPADDDVVTVRVTLPGDRQRIRQFSCISLLDLLRHRLLGEGTAPRPLG
jgi:PncC family amidohydrolase